MVKRPWKECFDDFMLESDSCPFYTEHFLYDLNKNEKNK